MDFDTWFSILLQLGDSPEGFVERSRMKLVSRFFRAFVNKLPATDKVCRFSDDIILHQLNTSLFNVFDCQTLAWELSADRPSRLLQPVPKTACGILNVYYNTYTCKYLQLDVHHGIWLQTSSIICDAGCLFRLAKLSLKASMKSQKPKKRVNQMSSHLRMYFDQMIASAGPTLSDPIHASITRLILKDTSISSDGLAIIAKNLSTSQIKELDVSCLIEVEDMASIFDNGDKLTYLNISYCLFLSESDLLALFRLLHRSRNLTHLKTMMTNMDCKEDHMLTFATVVQRSNIQKLSFSYPTDLACHYMAHAVAQLQQIKALQTSKLFSVVHEMETALKPKSDVYHDQLMDTSALLAALQMDVTVTLKYPDVALKLSMEGLVVESANAQFSEMKTQTTTERKRLQYDKRNAIRNQLLHASRKCKGCGTIWPAGSIKLQTFEGFQSLCWRTDRKCNTHQAYRRVFLIGVLDDDHSPYAMYRNSVR